MMASETSQTDNVPPTVPDDESQLPRESLTEEDFHKENIKDCCDCQGPW